MREVLTHPLPLIQGIQSGRMNAGRPRYVLQFGMDPFGGGEHGVVGLSALNQALRGAVDALTNRGIRIGRENLVVAIEHHRRLQIRPVNRRHRRFWPFGLDNRGRRHLQLGVRGMQVEGGHRGSPVVDVSVGPGRGGGLDAVDNHVLARIRAGRQTRLVVGGRDRSLVGITGGVDDPHPPHQCSPFSISLDTEPVLRPASDHSTHGASRKYLSDNASPTSRQVV